MRLIPVGLELMGGGFPWRRRVLGWRGAYADYIRHKTGVKVTLGCDHVRLEAAAGADLGTAVEICHIEAACDEALEWQGIASEDEDD